MRYFISREKCFIVIWNIDLQIQLNDWQSWHFNDDNPVLMKSKEIVNLKAATIYKEKHTIHE